MAAEEDQLRTQLQLVGLGAWQGGLGEMATALGFLDTKLDATAKRHLAVGIAAGSAAAAVAVALGKAAVAAGEEAAAYDNAANSFRSHNQQFSSGDIAAYASQLEDLTGIEDATIGKTLGLLGTFGLSQAQAKQLTPALLDAQRALEAQGVSAEGLALALGKAIQGGNVTGLRRMGVYVDEARFKMDRLGAVTEAVGRQGAGAAEKWRHSLPGELANLQNQLGNIQEALGTPLIKPISAVAGWVGNMARDLSRVPGFGEGLALALGVGVVGGAVLALRQVTLIRNALVEGAIAASSIAKSLGATGTGGIGGVGASAGATKAAGAGLGGILRAGGGVLAGVGIGEAGASLFGNQTAAGRAGSAFSLVGGHALAGAAIGSVIPGIGTLAGGILGGIEGGIEGALRFGAPGKAKAGSTAPTDPKQDQIIALLKEQNAILTGLKGSTGDYDQMGGSGRLFAGAQMLGIIRNAVR